MSFSAKFDNRNIINIKAMFDFTQITLVIGKCNKNTHAIDMLGTGFLISNEGKVVTARHVVGMKQMIYAFCYLIFRI